MPLDKMGFNVSGIGDITVPQYNFSSNVTKFINDIPDKANQYTGNFLGIPIMIGIAFYIYYKLSDKSEASSFGYSQIRSIGLSTGITGVVGMVMYAIGYFRQLSAVMFFVIIFMLMFIWTIKEEKW